MKRVITILLVLLFSLSLLGCGNKPDSKQIPPSPVQTEEQERQVVTSAVMTFGQKLQMVSLQAPSEQLRQDLQAQYGELVTPELLAQWQSQPASAPGRAVSSPWPDRIDIASIDKYEGGYGVKGQIVYVTSVEKNQGGAAFRQPIELKLTKSGDRWLIGSVSLGAGLKENTILYQNAEYGFDFVLPASWQGYTIIKEEWQGLGLGADNQGKVVAKGPKLSIRHPQWSSTQPRQDIPILVFTLEQWNSLQKEAFSIGAAPMGPKELARSSKYVFALPARYNYAFPTGFEEVESIVADNPLQPK